MQIWSYCYWDIQIHLMLLFIHPMSSGYIAKRGFKYISCYCLSFHRLLCLYNVIPFKYISCYCLSNYLNCIYNTNNSFKYISCYCLSFYLINFLLVLALFKYISCYCLSFSSLLWVARLTHSNTSHVIVYPTFPWWPDYHLPIQIHLMLLFIEKP